MTKAKKHEICTKELLEAYDYLAPDGSEIRLLVELGSAGLCHCTLPVGSVSKAISHKTVDELWYFTSGTGEVWRKQGQFEEIVSVKPGSSLTIPVGTVFQFRNSGDQPLCLIIATIPPWSGESEATPEQGLWQESRLYT